MSPLYAKAKPIRLLILDVDGVLTSGVIYYDSNGAETKGFHIQDGLGIKLLQQTGVTVAIISGKDSAPVVKRAQELNIEHCYLGHDDKTPPYQHLKQKLQLEDHEIAYMGDDLPDLPLLCRVGLAITVPDAPHIIHQQVDLITKKSGGAGAVREACQFIMEAQDRYQSVLQSYLLKATD